MESAVVAESGFQETPESAAPEVVSSSFAATEPLSSPVEMVANQPTEALPPETPSSLAFAEPESMEPASPEPEPARADPFPAPMVRETVAEPAAVSEVPPSPPALPSTFSPGELIERAVSRAEAVAPAPEPLKLPEGMVQIETRSAAPSQSAPEEPLVKLGRQRPAASANPDETAPMMQVETKQ